MDFDTEISAEHSANDQAIINKALQILERRARCNDANEQLAAPTAIRDWLRLKIGEAEREMFYAFYLDSDYRLLRAEEVTRGTSVMVPVYIREIARSALRCNASYCVVAHNHPGETVAKPSTPDLDATASLGEALSLVGVRLCDHVVVTRCETYSMAQNALFDDMNKRSS